jgi:hypothetical protein
MMALKLSLDQFDTCTVSGCRGSGEGEPHVSFVPNASDTMQEFKEEEFILSVSKTSEIKSEKSSGLTVS